MLQKIYSSITVHSAQATTGGILQVGISYLIQGCCFTSQTVYSHPSRRDLLMTLLVRCSWDRLQLEPQLCRHLSAVLIGDACCTPPFYRAGQFSGNYVKSNRLIHTPVKYIWWHKLCRKHLQMSGGRCPDSEVSGEVVPSPISLCTYLVWDNSSSSKSHLKNQVVSIS